MGACEDMDNTREQKDFAQHTFDEEHRDDIDNRLLWANMKEGYDRDRGQYYVDREQARRHAEEEHHMRMRHAEEEHAQRIQFREETFALRMRDQQQSMAHRDLAIAQQWRDQGRDSGESVFEPKQSS